MDRTLDQISFNDPLTFAVRKFHFVILDVNTLREEVKGDNFFLPLSLAKDIPKIWTEHLTKSHLTIF